MCISVTSKKLIGLRPLKVQKLTRKQKICEKQSMEKVKRYI